MKIEEAKKKISFGSNTDTNQVGAITLLDVLGWKGIWQKGFDPVIELSSFISLLKVEARRITDDLCNQYQELRGSQTEILSISDTIAIFTPGPAVPAIALHAGICSIAIPESIKRTIPVRGATTFGKFRYLNNIMIGPAVDEAAEWHETCDWMGVHLTPSAFLSVRGRLPFGWTLYPAPFKQGKYGDAACVIWNYDGQEPEIMQQFYEMGPHGPAVAHKYLNTLAYLKHIKQEVMPKEDVSPIIYWPGKEKRAKYEIDQFLRFYKQLTSKQFAIMNPNGKMDFDFIIQDVSTQQEIGVELTSVYIDDRSVPDVHMSNTEMTEITYDSGQIQKYLIRIEEQIRRKIKQYAKRKTQMPLVLSVYANEYVSIYVDDDQWINLGQRIQGLMVPFETVIVWPLPNQKALVVDGQGSRVMNDGSF